MTAPLKLTAITLNGVGSYLHGERLEIRPLTLLCGTNGSGKSTWLRVLNLLRQSFEAGCLPFSLNVDDRVHNYEYTNAILTNQTAVGDIESERFVDFGPPGTIGLEFETSEDWTLETNGVASTVTEPNTAYGFIWYGKLPPRTRLSVRLTQRNRDMTDDVAAAVSQIAELTIGDGFKACFVRPALEETWRLECSSGILDGQNAGLDVVGLGTFVLEGLNPVPCDGTVTPFSDDFDQLLKRVTQRFRDVFAAFLSGCFYLSAVRVPHEYPSLRDWVFRGDEIRVPYPPGGRATREDHYFSFGDARYVGPHGEATFALERRFAYCPMDLLEADPVLDHHLPLMFESFASYWLDKLLDVRILLKDDSSAAKGSHFAGGVAESLSDPWTAEGRIPDGILSSDKPVVAEQIHSNNSIESPDVAWDYDPNDVVRFMHPCFGGEELVPPARLSAGFHQVAPIVIQCGLAFQNELVAIENPEVHLHPSLQLNLAEFLIRQAKSGKLILVETHSDLIIRRVMREILEEDIGIGQEAIRVYFSDLDTAVAGYRVSSLKRLRLDEAGRIDWPDGFLGDDLHESRRLFNVMYGIVQTEDMDDGSHEEK